MHVEKTGFSPDDIPAATDSNNPAAHLSNRAPEHEHQAENKKEFAEDFGFHIIYFSSIFLCFRFIGLYRNQKTRFPKNGFAALKSLNGCLLRQGYGGQGSVEADRPPTSLGARLPPLLMLRCDKTAP